MPWDLALTMLAGSREVLTHTISANQQDYDLFAAVGSPTGPVELYLTLNSGIIVDTMTGTFPAGSTIIFTSLGTVRGRGGNGGAGGLAEGGSAGPASGPGIAGGDGAAAITWPGVELIIDMDDGNAWGGGGAGGGGGGAATLANDDEPGHGGGGGQGWEATTGGLAGSGLYGTADPGAAGGSTAPGAGGGPHASGGGKGGTGGAWGTNASNSGAGRGDWESWKSGGAAGAGGQSILAVGGTVTFNGAKSEATLVSDGRLKGSVVT